MSRFKTELCNNLIELGSCKYGDRCHYAHGAHELRQVSRRHPKYRTEKCKNFELTGKCPFGPRCSYVHPKPDLDSMIEQLTKYMKHTKAPKPDSEDDDDVSLAFTRTNTSISTCDSMLAIDDENKENNQRLFNYYQSTAPLSSKELSSRDAGQVLPLHQRNTSSSNLGASTPFLFNSTNVTVSSQAATSIRTPLANTSNNQSHNVLTPLNLTNENNYQVSDQISASKANNQGTNSKNLLIEATSYESTKKLRLNDIDPSNTNNTISYPFAISNPLSDFLNITNVNGRSPLNPNKQFYTRF